MISVKDSSKIVRGSVLTIIGGICWGFSGACGQYLFTNYGADAAWLTSVRMIFSGIILIAYGMITAREQMIAILKNRRDLITLLCFSVFGLLFCQYAYLLAIAHSNAGTATVLQYLFPIFIMLYVCTSTRRLPKKVEVVSIILALAGSFILATHGDLQKMAITEQGLTWGILAGIAVALYSLIPRSLIEKHGSVAVTGYGMLLGGALLCLFGQTAGKAPVLDLGGLVAVCAIVLIGTVFAFSLYFQGVKDIGAVRASMLVSVEIVSATLFAMIWLKTQFALMDLIGFACIASIVVLLSRKEAARKDQGGSD